MVRLDSIGNKFEFITIAAERCKQLQRGARPRIETLSTKFVTVAQEEVLNGAIPYSYGPFPEEAPAQTEVSEVTTEAYVAEDTGLAGE
ncbi:MAG TPA: DNA-directed RNA polymerase subunit omega [Candidatus Cryosericum sp.]|nr:DNA-directed RNA polymerase subunit omega [Candidatus Cryosericum sp.]